MVVVVGEMGEGEGRREGKDEEGIGWLSDFCLGDQASRPVRPKRVQKRLSVDSISRGSDGRINVDPEDQSEGIQIIGGGECCPRHPSLLRTLSLFSHAPP